MDRWIATAENAEADADLRIAPSVVRHVIRQADSRLYQLEAVERLTDRRTRSQPVIMPTDVSFEDRPDGGDAQEASDRRGDPKAARTLSQNVGRMQPILPRLAVFGCSPPPTTSDQPFDRALRHVQQRYEFLGPMPAMGRLLRHPV